MIPFSNKAVILFAWIFIIVSSCSKEDLNPGPKPVPGDPVPPVGKGTVHFNLNIDLTGHPYHSSNLQAVVSIANDKGEEVIKDKALTLTLPNPVKTTTIELPAGNYKLTRFRLVYGTVNTHFAAPITGSAKAALVQKPLALDVKVEANTNRESGVEVLKVQAGEKPQAFGYPSGAFDDGQEDANPYLKVKLRAIMQIGDVLYDSIPASLRLTTWNDKGEMTTSYSALKAGVNEVPVLKAARKFEFLVSKWGTNDAITLNRSEVDDVTVYTLGGSKEAKKLRSERVYKLVNGIEVPESKKDYIYDGAGKISRIEYWEKKQDKSNYLVTTEEFEYLGGRVARINRFDKIANSLQGYTSFTYDNQGKIVTMYQKMDGKETNGAVEYSFTPTPSVKIHYTYPGLSYDMNYYMNFYGGNMILGAANTSHHNNEVGRYDHDLNINPYRHLELPDLFLSNSSKNNITFQRKEYHGSYPVTEPYSFSYAYDADGYPTQVIKNYRTYLTGQFAFSTKTVFVY